MKKGFTLIELLAVVVILALLAMIAVPSAIAISTSIKKNLYCEKVDMLLIDAERWGDEHTSRLSEDCYYEITVADLVEQDIQKCKELGIKLAAGARPTGKPRTPRRKHAAFPVYVEPITRP